MWISNTSKNRSHICQARMHWQLPHKREFVLADMKSPLTGSNDPKDSTENFGTQIWCTNTGLVCTSPHKSPQSPDALQKPRSRGFLARSRERKNPENSESGSSGFCGKTLVTRQRLCQFGISKQCGKHTKCRKGCRGNSHQKCRQSLHVCNVI